MVDSNTSGVDLPRVIRRPKGHTLRDSTIASLRAIAEALDDRDGTSHHLAAVDSALAGGPEFENAWNRGLTSRGLPYGMRINSKQLELHNATGRDFVQHVVAPLKAALSSPALPVDENPFHPYFLGARGVLETNTLIARAKKAGLDDSHGLLLAMIAVSIQTTAREFLVVPNTIDVSGLRILIPPMDYWHRVIVDTGRSVDLRAYGRTGVPSLAEMWGYRSTIYPAIARLSGSLFSGDSELAMKVLAIATGLYSPAATVNDVATQRVRSAELDEAVRAHGFDILRPPKRLPNGPDLQRDIFAAVAAKDFVGASVAAVALTALYPDAVTPRSREYGLELATSKIIQRVVSGLTDRSLGKPPPLRSKDRQTLSTQTQTSTTSQDTLRVFCEKHRLKPRTRALFGDISRSLGGTLDTITVRDLEGFTMSELVSRWDPVDSDRATAMRSIQNGGIRLRRPRSFSPPTQYPQMLQRSLGEVLDEFIVTQQPNVPESFVVNVVAGVGAHFGWQDRHKTICLGDYANLTQADVAALPSIGESGMRALGDFDAQLAVQRLRISPLSGRLGGNVEEQYRNAWASQPEQVPSYLLPIDEGPEKQSDRSPGRARNVGLHHGPEVIVPLVQSDSSRIVVEVEGLNAVRLVGGPKAQFAYRQTPGALGVSYQRSGKKLVMTDLRSPTADTTCDPLSVFALLPIVSTVVVAECEESRIAHIAGPVRVSVARGQKSDVSDVPHVSLHVSEGGEAKVRGNGGSLRVTGVGPNLILDGFFSEVEFELEGGTVRGGVIGELRGRAVGTRGNLTVGANGLSDPEMSGLKFQDPSAAESDRIRGAGSQMVKVGGVYGWSSSAIDALYASAQRRWDDRHGRGSAHQTEKRSLGRRPLQRVESTVSARVLPPESIMSPRTPEAASVETNDPGRSSHAPDQVPGSGVASTHESRGGAGDATEPVEQGVLPSPNADGRRLDRHRNAGLENTPPLLQSKNNGERHPSSSAPSYDIPERRPTECPNPPPAQLGTRLGATDDRRFDPVQVPPVDLLAPNGTDRDRRFERDPRHEEHLTPGQGETLNDHRDASRPGIGD